MPKYPDPATVTKSNYFQEPQWFYPERHEQAMRCRGCGSSDFRDGKCSWCRQLRA